MQEVASGIDALYLSGRASIPLDVFEGLDSLRAAAARCGEPARFSLGGEDFQVAPHSWGKHRVLLEHQHGRVGLTPSDALPSLRVQPVAGFLHAVGPGQVAPWFSAQFEAAFGPIEWTVSRVDLFADVTGWRLSSNDRERFVCRAKARTTHEEAESLTGFSFGRRTGAIFGRIYDKTIEVAGSGKTWWHDKWANRWDGSAVQRVELQMNRDALRQFGLSTPDEVLTGAGGLWAHGTGEWLTFRSPSVDSNKSRWPIAPEWQAVQNATLKGDALGLPRVTTAERAASLERLMPALRGYLGSAGALLGARTYDETVERLRIHLVKLSVRRTEPFEKLLVRRSAQLGLS